MLKIAVKNKFIKFAIILFIILFSIFTVFYLSGILFMFILSYFIAFTFEPAIKYLQKKKIKRVYSVILIWSFLILLIFLIVIPVIFSILAEIAELGPKIGEYTNAFADKIEAYEAQDPESAEGVLSYFAGRFFKFFQFFDITERTIIDFLLGNFRNFLNYTGNFLRNNINKVISSFIYIFTIPIISFYFMLDFSIISEKIKLFTGNKNENIKNIINETEKDVSKFFRGQLIICFIVGSLLGFGFFLIEVDFPHLLGFIAGLANLIPYFGAFMSTAIALLFSLLKFGFTSEFLFILLKILILVTIVQSLDAFFLSPKILGTKLNLSPVLIMFFLFTGGTIAGILGMFLSIPTMLIIRVLYKNLKIKFVNEKEN
ncbi:MAG: AI-2E family transporter [Candidatus Muiribacteriota bacterium]